MNSYPELERRSEFKNVGVFIRDNKPFVFSIIAACIAFANLAFGLFINLSSKLLNNVLESDNYHFIVVMLIISVVMSAVSVALGIFALTYYPKSSRESLNRVAVFVVILSFVLSISSLILDVIGLFVW